MNTSGNTNCTTQEQAELIVKKILDDLNSPELTSLRWRDHERLFKIYYTIKTRKISDKRMLKLIKQVLNESIVDYWTTIEKVQPGDKMFGFICTLLLVQEDEQ
jgi:hypothetical protein